MNERSKYEFLVPPDSNVIYRGLFNVTAHEANNIRELTHTDPVRDKSWTLSRTIATKFARGEFTRDEHIVGRYGIVMKGQMPDLALLNWRLTSIEENIGDQWNDIWNEPLALSIRSEREVIVGETVEIIDVEIIEL